MEGYIHEGYYIMARKESWIDHQPPYTREIFRYFIRMATHADSKEGKIKRGQLLCTYSGIIEALSWYVGYRKMTYKKHQCENATKQLKKAAMIATKRTTRGMIVTVCNYGTYQTPQNYESHSHSPPPKAGTEPEQSRTINKKDKNVKNDKKKTYQQNSDEFRLASLLGSLILERKPDYQQVLKAQKNNYQKWAVHIDRMFRLDNREPVVVEKVIRWSQADTGNSSWGGWQNNILSTEKLREKFDVLELQMIPAKAAFKPAAQVLRETEAREATDG